MSPKRADVTRAPVNPQTTNRLFSKFLLPLRRKPRALPGVFRTSHGATGVLGAAYSMDSPGSRPSAGLLKTNTRLDRTSLRRATALALLLLLTIPQNTFAHGQRGDVGDLYVCNLREGNILQYHGLTGEFVCIFAERPPDMGSNDFNPLDLAWVDGHLWVVSDGANPFEGGAVVEYDGQTGDFLGYVVPPDAGAAAASLTLGGPNGDMYLTVRTPNGRLVRRYDRVTREYQGVALDPGPSMRPNTGRFASHGNYLLLGKANLSPAPVLQEYEPAPDGTLMFKRTLHVESFADKYNLIETPDGGYLITDLLHSRVDRCDIDTGLFLDVFLPRSPCLDLGPQLPPQCDAADPCYWDAMNVPVDLAYGPDGRLYVSSEQTAVPTDASWMEFSLCKWNLGAVHVFDPQTGEQVQVIGKNGIQSFAVVGDPEHLYKPQGIEFKPLPGDWGASGAAYQGDWNVDEADLARFLVALEDNRRTVGSESSLFLAANLLSFDFDRNGAIDCADWPPFAAAFEASRGYAPSPPLPETSVFIDALLGDESAVCVSDCNADGTVDGQDIASYLAAVLDG